MAATAAGREDHPVRRERGRVLVELAGTLLDQGRLALDLATWAAGVAERLYPATLVDRDTGAVAAEAHALVTALRSPPR